MGRLHDLDEAALGHLRRWQRQPTRYRQPRPASQRYDPDPELDRLLRRAEQGQFVRDVFLLILALLAVVAALSEGLAGLLPALAFLLLAGFVARMAWRRRPWL